MSDLGSWQPMEYSPIGSTQSQPNYFNNMWGAVAAAGASLLGNLLGSGSSKSTNKTNLKIAQMNNDFNREMFNRQIEYNWDMWNAQNEYNTASAQRERLEDAGLNPYLMLLTGRQSVQRYEPFDIVHLARMKDYQAAKQLELFQKYQV